MPPRPGRTAALLAASALLAAPALAQDWDVTLGFGAALAPTYDGAADRQLDAFPFFDLAWRDTVFLSLDGLGASVLRRDGFDLTASVGFTPGRSEEDDDALEGLGDIEGAANVGLAATQALGAYELGLDLTRTLGDAPGTRIELGLGRSWQAGERLGLSAGLSATYADADWASSRYGVSGGQSAASGLPAYDAEGGFERADLTLSATYALTERAFVGVEVGLGRLLGDAADSPIVQDDTQASVALLTGYRF